MRQGENYLAQSIFQVYAAARYDEGVKRLLANKSILAMIMKECVPEYRDCEIREIAGKRGAKDVQFEPRRCRKSYGEGA